MAKTEATTKDKVYYEGIGRRKTALARVRIFADDKQHYTINDKELEDYFPTPELQKHGHEPFTVTKLSQKFFVSALIRGGGIHAQAEALRHGIARALEKYDAELRQPLKKAGFLKRDPRMIERKKFGLKKARKRAQWSKR